MKCQNCGEVNPYLICSKCQSITDGEKNYISSSLSPAFHPNTSASETSKTNDLPYPRKIITICGSCCIDGNKDSIVALCSDNTLWYFKCDLDQCTYEYDSRWTQLPDIPGDSINDMRYTLEKFNEI